MNDSQALTLRAFLAALTQHPLPLPKKLRKDLDGIADNLNQRVAELHNLVNKVNSDTLRTFYKAARRWLSSSAAERKAGLKFLPDNHPEIDFKEIENTVPVSEIHPDFTTVLKTLEDSNKDVLATKAPAVLKADKPGEIFTALFSISD